MLMFLLAVAAGVQAAAPPAAAPPPADPPPGDDIVVTARPSGQCVYTVPNRSKADQNLEAQLHTWSPDHAIRVIITHGTSQKCRTKIMFMLADRGFRLVQFVEPAHDIAPPEHLPAYPSAPTHVQGSLGSGGGGGSGSVRQAEQAFTRRRAAQMIEAGHCDEALKFALSMHDLDTATEVSTVCRAVAPAKK